LWGWARPTPSLWKGIEQTVRGGANLHAKMAV
jgi:hypothetical protein